MKTTEQKTAEEILEKHGFKIMCHIQDSDSINEIFVKPLIEAMQEFANQESDRKQDELIEKIRTFVSMYEMNSNELEDWLKSLKS